MAKGEKREQEGSKYLSKGAGFYDAEISIFIELTGMRLLPRFATPSVGVLMLIRNGIFGHVQHCFAPTWCIEVRSPHATQLQSGRRGGHTEGKAGREFVKGPRFLVSRVSTVYPAWHTTQAISRQVKSGVWQGKPSQGKR